jgi:glutathione S-transferase
MVQPRLVTIPISHYCEKARWALERAGIGYREEPHVQGIHQLAARRAGGGVTVPVLVTDGGAVGESQQILEWVDERTPPEHRLFSQDPLVRLQELDTCARLDALLGPSARRLVYVHMLPQRRLMLDYNNQGVPVWEDRAIRMAWPVFFWFARRVLGISPAVQAGDEATLWREMDFVAALLADGRPFLYGERFGAADLTFACMSAALTWPAEYAVALPDPRSVRPATRSLVMRVREHPAGRYAMSLFAAERRRSLAA